VEFAVLPPASGPLPRAIDIAVLPRTKRALASAIMVIHGDGVLRVTLRQGRLEIALGELDIGC